MIKIGINGFGRIGRCIFRALIESGRKDIVLNAINVGMGDLDAHYHLLRYDSTHGVFAKFTVTEDSAIDYGHGKAKVIAEMDPKKIDWRSLDVDIVLECTGAFVTRDSAAAHLEGGAKKVIVSAPCQEADATIVLGVNEHVLTHESKVISIGSCTTNCLAPLAKVLHDSIGIESGFMTTIHAYTNDQVVLDGLHKDKRRARACAASIIPSSTGAAKALGLVIPELDGRLDGVAMRVPTANVSLVDLKFNAINATSIEEINQLMQVASLNSKVISCCHEELVSIDFNHNSSSCVFDATQTRVVSGKFCRVAAWYDNEWGFSNRMLDISVILGAI